MEKLGCGAILMEGHYQGPWRWNDLQSCPYSGKEPGLCNPTWTHHWVRAAWERGNTSLGEADAISTGQFPKIDLVMSHQVLTCLADGG